MLEPSLQERMVWEISRQRFLEFSKNPKTASFPTCKPFNRKSRYTLVYFVGILRGVVILLGKCGNIFQSGTVNQKLHVLFYSPLEIFRNSNREAKRPIWWYSSCPWQVYKQNCVKCQENFSSRLAVLEHMEKAQHFALPEDKTAWDQPQWVS